MRLWPGTAALCVLTAGGGAAQADTIYVPDDYGSIQMAILFAQDGDEILVRPGTYHETINLIGKAIWLHSTDGRDVTTIDAGFPDPPMSVVTCDNGEGPDTILEGFTITGGTGTWIEYEGENYLEGGGMFIEETSPTVKDCTFEDNVVLTAGGGLFAWRGDPTIEGSTFRLNVAESGGGMFVTQGGATIESSLFEDNTATYGGGLEAWDDATVLVRGCTFRSNDATGAPQGGGGLAVAVASATVVECLFEENASVGSGAGIVLFGGDLSVTDSTFIRNVAQGSGGGIWNHDSTLRVERTTFEANEGYTGGALVLRSQTEPVVIGCTFVENVARHQGGAMFCESTPDVEVMNSEFRGNIAINGGALTANHNTTPVLTNVLLVDNEAELGAAIYNINSHTVLTNATLTANVADIDGGGMYSVGDSHPHIRNSILWGDVGQEIVDLDTSSTKVDFCDVQGGAGGKGNIDADPRFVDPANGDYRLAVDSTCTDAAANNALPSDRFDLDEDADTGERLPIDLDGNYRFADNPEMTDTGCGMPVVVDMGVYEYQGDPIHPMRVGDVDGDEDVDFNDMISLLAWWGACDEDCCLADLDFDEEVEMDDLLLLLSNWGD